MTTSYDCVYTTVKVVTATHRYCFANIDLASLGNSIEVTRALNLASAVQIWAVSWYYVVSEASAVLLCL